MADWVADFLTRNPDKAALPVEKRAKHAIHFRRPDGQIEAHFTGAPQHYLDTDGLWKPLDTALKSAPDGFYGAPGLDVLIHLDGRVKVKDSNYQQFIELPGNPNGTLDGDRIVRSFAGGRQYLYLTETGYREEIVIDKKTFPFEKFIIKKTGTLPVRFTEGTMLAKDKNGMEFIYRGDSVTFGKWLDNAIYPVIIDPDFTSDAADASILGISSSYASAHDNASNLYTTATDIWVSQALSGSLLYYLYRGFMKFVTNSIPDSANITQVNLNLVCTFDHSDTDCIIEVVEQDWSASDPITDGNKETVFDACYDAANHIDWRSTSGMEINTQYSSGNLTTAYVSKTASTYYSLRSDKDKASTAPTGYETITIGANENTTPGYRPVLTVVYPYVLRGNSVAITPYMVF